MNTTCDYQTYILELGAGNETRTRDPDLGKVVLYQLSYSRIKCRNLSDYYFTLTSINFGAGNETRTRDPDLGKVVLYQLSYSRVPNAERINVTGCALYEN